MCGSSVCRHLADVCSDSPFTDPHVVACMLECAKNVPRVSMVESKVRRVLTQDPEMGSREHHPSERVEIPNAQDVFYSSEWYRMVRSHRGRSNEVFTFIRLSESGHVQVLNPGMWDAKPGIQIHEMQIPDRRFIKSQIADPQILRWVKTHKRVTVMWWIPMEWGESVHALNACSEPRPMKGAQCSTTAQPAETTSRVIHETISESIPQIDVGHNQPYDCTMFISRRVM